MSWWSGDIRNYSTEEFHGYFGEIRLIANRTLPRRPPREILALLHTGTFHSPYAQAESALTTPSSILSTKEFPYFPETTEFTYSPNEDLHLDLGGTQSTEDRFSYFPVSARTRLHEWQQDYDRKSQTSEDKKCSKNKKVTFGTAAFLAIAILVLVVIVGTLITSLRSLDANIDSLKKITSSISDNSGSSSVIENSPNVGNTLSTSNVERISDTPKILSSQSQKTTIKTQPSPAESQTSPEVVKTTFPVRPSTKQSTTVSTTTKIKSTVSSTPGLKTSIPKTTTAASSITMTTSSTSPKLFITTMLPSLISSVSKTTLKSTSATTSVPSTSKSPTSVATKLTTISSASTSPSTSIASTSTTSTTMESTTTTSASTSASSPSTSTTSATIKRTTTSSATTSASSPRTSTTSSTTQSKTTTTSPITLPEEKSSSTILNTKAITTTISPSTSTTKNSLLSTKRPQTTSFPSTKRPDQTTTPSKPELCETSYCNSLAYEMLGRINTSVNPCTDFYNYACGAWISSRRALLEAEVIDASRSSVLDDVKMNLRQKVKEMLEADLQTSDSDYLKAIKMHYQSCLQSNSRADSSIVTNEIQKLLESLGVGRSFSSFMTPSEMQYMIYSDFGAFGFFNYEVVAEMVGNKKIKILQLSPPKLFLKEESYVLPFNDNDLLMAEEKVRLQMYVERDHFVNWKLSHITSDRFEGESYLRRLEVAMRYLNRIVPLLQRFNPALKPNSSSDEVDINLRNIVEKVFEFERQVSQAIRLAKTATDTQTKQNLAELRRNYPNINWSRALPYQQIAADSPINIFYPYYFQILNGMLNNTENSILVMYLYIKTFLTSVWPTTPYSTRRFMDNLYIDETAVKFSWLDCLNSTLQLLPEETFVEYALKNSQTSATKQYVQKVVNNLTLASGVALLSYDGYSSTTKEYASQKLNSISLSFAKPPDIPWTITLSSDNNVLHLFRAKLAHNAHVHRLMNSIGEEVIFPDTHWYDVTPVYDDDIKIIGIPFGLLTWKTDLTPEFPFLTTVGWILSSTISSSIFGTLRNNFQPSNWSDTSLILFREKYNCFMNQLFEKNTTTGKYKTNTVMSGHIGLYILQQEYQRLMRDSLIKKYRLPFLSLDTEQLFYLSFAQVNIGLLIDRLLYHIHESEMQFSHFASASNFEMCKIDEINTPLSSKARVNNILMNDNKFTQSFRCPLGSPMNPLYKCHVFKDTNYTIPPTTTSKPTTQEATTTRSISRSQLTTLQMTTVTHSLISSTTAIKSPTSTQTSTYIPKTRSTSTTFIETRSTTKQSSSTTVLTTTPTKQQSNPSVSQSSTSVVTSGTSTTSKSIITEKRPTDSTITVSTWSYTSTPIRPTTTELTTPLPTTTALSTTLFSSSPSTRLTTKSTSTTLSSSTNKVTTTPFFTSSSTTVRSTKPAITSAEFSTTVQTTNQPTSISTLSTSTTLYKNSTAQPRSTQSTTPSGPSVCGTAYCYSQAESITSRLDDKINPCSDFYRYACGGWISERQNLLHTFSESRESVVDDNEILFKEDLKGIVEKNVTESDSMYMKAIKMHYQSCLQSNFKPDDEEVTTDLRILMEILGIGSDLKSYMSPSAMNLMITTDYGGSGVFYYDVVPVIFGDTKKNILKLSPPKLYLQRTSYRSPFENNEVAKQYVEKLVTLIQRSSPVLDTSNGDEVLNATLRERVKEVFEFEQQLEKAIPTSLSDFAIDITVTELQQRFPYIAWTEILPYQQIYASTPIKLSSPSYFQELNQLFNDTNPDVIVMYLYARVLLTAILPYTPLSTRRLMDGIYNQANNTQYSWNDCLNSTLSVLSDEFQTEYENLYRNKTVAGREFLLRMTRNLTTTFKNHFILSTEYSTFTKNSIVQKLERLEFRYLQTPSIPWTITLSTSRSIPYMMRANYAMVAYMYRLLNAIGTTMVSPDIKWFETKINLDPDINVIGIPYGAMHFHTIFSPEFPTFATTGWRVASLIIEHVFDDLSFILTPLNWSPESTRTFTEKRDCFNTQLSETLTNDGVFRSGEVMEGSAGFDLVTKVYNELVRDGLIASVLLPTTSLSPTQMFYLAFAQQMCEIDGRSGIISNQYIVNNILKNDLKFSESFTCPTGSIMNPVTKCRVTSLFNQSNEIGILTK